MKTRVLMKLLPITIPLAFAGSVRAVEPRSAPLMGVPVMTGLELVRPAVASPPASAYPDAWRDTLNSRSPFALEALQTVEARRGVRYSADEFPAVSHTPEYRAELDLTRQRFCARTGNASSFACSLTPAPSPSPSKRPMRTTSREDDVVRTARKTLSGNEEVIVAP